MAEVNDSPERSDCAVTGFCVSVPSLRYASFRAAMLEVVPANEYPKDLWSQTPTSAPFG